MEENSFISGKFFIKFELVLFLDGKLLAHCIQNCRELKGDLRIKIK